EGAGAVEPGQRRSLERRRALGDRLRVVALLERRMIAGLGRASAQRLDLGNRGRSGQRRAERSTKQESPHTSLLPSVGAPYSCPRIISGQIDELTIGRSFAPSRRCPEA